MPPRIATAKALMPNSVPMVEEMVNNGATRMPAMPASNPDSANAISITRSTRMPISRAASLFCTTASSALPCRDVDEQQLQSGRHRQADHRNERLNVLDPDAGDGKSAGGEHAGRHAARVLAEREQHDVIEHDAERDGRDQPGIRAARHERTHRNALDDDAPERAGGEREHNRERQRPSERRPRT